MERRAKSLSPGRVKWRQHMECQVYTCPDGTTTAVDKPPMANAGPMAGTQAWFGEPKTTKYGLLELRKDILQGTTGQDVHPERELHVFNDRVVQDSKGRTNRQKKNSIRYSPTERSMDIANSRGSYTSPRTIGRTKCATS